MKRHIRTSTLPGYPITEWVSCGDVAYENNQTVVLAKEDDGLDSEQGIVSIRDFSGVELEFQLRMTEETLFVAKLMLQEQFSQESNSYHLLLEPSGGYIARHDHLLSRFTFRGNGWMSCRFRRLRERLELYVDNTVLAAVSDGLLRRGFCFLGVKGGRADVREIRMFNLTQPTLRPTSVRENTVRYAHRQPASVSHTIRTGRDLTWTCMPRRNLIYHIWPVKDSAWQWNLDNLLQRIDIFNGRRLIGIVHDGDSEDPDVVKQILQGHGCDFIVMPNDPVGEVNTFPELIRGVASDDENEVTFYAHAKGVSYGPNFFDPVRVWVDTLYRTNLDDWGTVGHHLQEKAMTGSFRLLGRVPNHGNLGDWHYSGSFFWMRHTWVFKRNYADVPQFYGGVEAWPGILFDVSETGCLFLDDLRQLPYSRGFWETTALPELERWHANLRPTVTPDDLLHPLPVDGYEWPRTEQKPAEFKWWVDQLLACGVCRLLTIGAFHGGAEWHTARLFRQHERDIEITAIDIEPTMEAQQAFHDAFERFGQTMRLLPGDSASGAIRHQLQGQYDAVFIDAGHSYRQARQDWLLAKSLGPKLVGVHDIVDSDFHVHSRCCVSRLWAEISAAYEFEERTSADWGGIGIVWLP